MDHAIAFDPTPYPSIVGSDFTRDFVFFNNDGSFEDLGQVEGASLKLFRQGVNSVSLEYELGSGLTKIAPNVIRLALDKPTVEAWPVGEFVCALFLRWADGTDDAPLQFITKRSEFWAAKIKPRSPSAGPDATMVQRDSTVTHIVRTASGRLTSIVPQIALTALTWPETTPIGETVSIAILNPVGAAVTYSLADDFGGAVSLDASGHLQVQNNPDALVHPTFTIVIEAAVADGATVLRSPFTLTLQPQRRGRLRFNDPLNSALSGN